MIRTRPEIDEIIMRYAKKWLVPRSQALQRIVMEYDDEKKKDIDKE